MNVVVQINIPFAKDAHYKHQTPKSAAAYNAAMGKGKTKKPSDNTIAQNKRARFEYHLLDTFEAGVSLMGWEVKALRAGRVQLTDSFVVMTKGEAFFGRPSHAFRYCFNALRC